MPFKEIIGQVKAKDIISGQLRSGNVPHAYLFLGPDGVGRRKTALALAKALNCQTNDVQQTHEPEPCDHCLSCKKIEKGLHPDVQMIDFAFQARIENKDIEKQKVLKIDTIRALQKEISLKASEGRWKIFIIEPAEKITVEAANCLLKTLEEPPRGTVVILLAKHRENLPATIVSRTQIVLFAPLPEHEVRRFLQNACAINEEKARLIAHDAEGSLSSALSKIGEKMFDLSDFWKTLHTGGCTTTELLSHSQKNAKNAHEFLSELLSCAKNDFRADPARFSRAIEAVLYSQKLLEKNANPQMVLDVLLLKISNLKFQI